MADTSKDLPEIMSFNVSELDVSGLDMRLELTTLLPRAIAPDCGPSFNCSCYGNTACTCHFLNVTKCQCHADGLCGCHSNICQCHTVCEINE